MKKIAVTAEDIREELEGAEHYAKLATQYKTEDRLLADVYATLAAQELAHVDMLHAQVARVIKEYRAAGNEPPAGMMEVWNYEHGRHMDSVVKIKLLLDAYKK